MKPRALSIIPWILAGVLAGSTQLQAQPRPLWGRLEPGTYEVGFRRVWTLDRSRIWPRSSNLDSLKGNVARPIRIDVWYPAKCVDRQRVRLRNYLNMEPPGADFEDLVFLTHRWDEYSYRGLVNKDSTAFDRLMNAETAVCSSATAAPGRFPLVMYSAGWFNRAPDNTILAEFLATHGFVVATVPQLNPGLWTFNFRSDARSVENQVRDLEVAIGKLVDEPFVNRTHIAAMGYSTGGDVALLLQGRNPLIDAVVGLDASWTLGSDNDVLSSPFFTAEVHSVPILAARRPPQEDAGANAVLDVLTAAPRIVVDIPGADHGSFSDDPGERRLLGTDTEEHQNTHALVAKTVVGFLRAAFVDGDVFNGKELTEQYRAGGLRASFVPGAIEKTESNDPER